LSEQPDQQEALQKGQQVAQAGAQAAAQAPPEQAEGAARDAMRAERDRLGFEQLPDSEIDRIASVLSPKLIEGFRAQGAFDPPPEPVAPPAQPAQAAAGAEPVQAPAAGEPAPAPEKRTWAHRYLGV
jgi:hypothetical protein